MRYLSLFSGIEAASQAWHPLGWECVAVSEIEGFPCELLKQRWPNAKNLGDITKITEDDIMMLGHLDLVVFGSPCQDLSVAGKRKGLDGARSGLFFDAMRIIGWARTWCGLRGALWENVPGAFTSNKGADFAAVVDALAGLDGTIAPEKGWGNEGCAVGEEAMVEWSTLDAQWFGVAQRRRRVFAVADFGNWAGRPPILLEPQGMRGGSAPSRGAREDVAGALAASTGGSDENDAAADGRLVAERGPVLNSSTGEVAHCLNAGGMGRIDYETETMICVTGNVTHPLKADGFYASEDGTGHGTPIVVDSGVKYAHYSHEYAHDRITDPTGVAPSLTRMANSSGGLNIVAFNYNAQACQLPTEGGRDTSVADAPTCSQGVAVAYAIQERASCENPLAGPDGVGVRGDDLAYTLEARTVPQVVAFQSSQSGIRLDDVHATLDSHNGPRRHNGALQHMRVRRLTPRECERLQGMADDYTAITVRGKPAADGPRYKALGNSMAVPVMHWIGRQIDFAWRFF